MSQTAVADRKAQKMSDKRYPLIDLNGEPVQAHEGMLLEFILEDSKKIRIELTAFKPIDPKYDARGIARFSGDYQTVYSILPASRVWINGAEHSEFIGLAYAADDRKAFPLIQAVDDWGVRKIESKIKYRSLGSSSILGKSRRVVDIVIVERDPQPEPAPAV